MVRELCALHFRPERVLGDDYPHPSLPLLHRLVLLRIHQDLREVTRTLRLVLLREIPEDENLRHQWNALVARVDQSQVFYTYEWSLAVQRAYHATLPTLLFLAYDEGDALCGIAALAADVGGSHVSFLCATTGDYCDFLSMPEHKPAFVRGGPRGVEETGIDDLTLTNLPTDSDTVAALRNASNQTGYRCFARTAYVCAQVSLSKLERRPGETKPVLPRKKMLRRSLNAMGREEPVRLDHACIGSNQRHLAGVHAGARGAVSGSPGVSATWRARNVAIFWRNWPSYFRESGWLVLTRMVSGKNSYAWNYGFQFRGYVVLVPAHI